MNIQVEALGAELNQSSDTLIVGVAEHSKAGAVVITEKNQVYYIEGKYDWDSDNLHKSKIRVCGILKKIHRNKEELGDKNKVYKQGILGEQLIITNASWKKADVEKSYVLKDSKINHLRKSLPPNWELKINADTLQVIRDEPVYCLFENQINAPINTFTQDEQEERIKKYGRLINSRFAFSMVARFSDNEIKIIQNINYRIEAQIGALPEKYNIEHLSYKSKRGIDYRGQSEDEKKAVNAYEKERNDLTKKIIALPDYHTEFFSLYLAKEEGMNEEFSLIWPPSASEEMWKIKYDLINTIFAKTQ